MRYILALVPPEQQKRAYVQAAQTAFSSICDGYMLSEEKSLPHITLCSFQCDDEKLTQIYRGIEKWKINSCSMRVMGLMLKKGKVPPHHYSVSLSIAREPAILHLHYQTLHLLNDFNITPLNPNEDLYFPHLTLAGIRFADSVSLTPIIDDLISMPVDPFRLVLGRGDDIGQYLETLHQFNEIS